MLDTKTEELAGLIFANFLGGWAASGRAMPAPGKAEAQMAIMYARAMQAAVKEERSSDK